MGGGRVGKGGADKGRKIALPFSAAFKGTGFLQALVLKFFLG